jgi:glycosyltransferase involved in cell wall biosynthesis
LNLATRLELWIYKNADFISGQTQGICKSIKDRTGQSVFWLRNGFDFSQYIPAEFSDFKSKNKIDEKTFTVLYAGVIGHAHGLEVIIKAAMALKNVQFVLVGDGPEKENLKQAAHAAQLTNVLFIPNTPRKEIPAIVAGCDAYVVPLKKLDLFLGAIPSKIFEPLALGCPVLLGVDGEAKEIFVEDGKCALHFEPENASQLIERINELKADATLQKSLKENGRAFVKNKFNRQSIAHEFYDFLKL